MWLARATLAGWHHVKLQKRSEPDFKVDNWWKSIIRILSLFVFMELVWTFDLSLCDLFLNLQGLFKSLVWSLNLLLGDHFSIWMFDISHLSFPVLLWSHWPRVSLACITSCLCPVSHSSAPALMSPTWVQWSLSFTFSFVSSLHKCFRFVP